MTREHGRLVRWVSDPVILARLVLAFGAATFVAVSLGLWVAVDQAQTRATTRAAHDAACALFAFQVGQPGDPPPSTARGVVMVGRARYEYQRIHCKPALPSK